MITGRFFVVPGRRLTKVWKDLRILWLWAGILKLLRRIDQIAFLVAGRVFHAITDLEILERMS